MAYRNDGGAFSDDPIARLLALKMGSVSNEDLAQQERIPEEAINLASGTMGTIGSRVGKMAPEAMNVAEQTLPSMADKIRQATMNSKVKGPEGGLVDNLSMYQKGSQPGNAITDYWSNLRRSMSGK